MPPDHFSSGLSSLPVLVSFHLSLLNAGCVHEYGIVPGWDHGLDGRLLRVDGGCRPIRETNVGNNVEEEGPLAGLADDFERS